MAGICLPYKFDFPAQGCKIHKPELFGLNACSGRPLRFGHEVQHHKIKDFKAGVHPYKDGDSFDRKAGFFFNFPAERVGKAEVFLFVYSSAGEIPSLPVASFGYEYFALRVTNYSEYSDRPFFWAHCSSVRKISLYEEHRRSYKECQPPHLNCFTRFGSIE